MLTKRGFLASVAGGVSGLYFGSLGRQPATAQAQVFSPQLPGSWLVSNVTPQGLQTRALFTFHPDGTLTQVNVNHPTQSPGHGTWRQATEREFDATFWSLEFDREGTLIGT